MTSSTPLRPRKETRRNRSRPGRPPMNSILRWNRKRDRNDFRGGDLAGGRCAAIRVPSLLPREQCDQGIRRTLHLDSQRSNTLSYYFVLFSAPMSHVSVVTAVSVNLATLCLSRNASEFKGLADSIGTVHNRRE